MNKLAITIAFPLSSLLLGVTPSMAGRVDPITMECLFFRNGQLELTQTCIFSGFSWMGGGATILEWDDGTTTKIAFGIQGRGERPCPQLSVDDVCGEWRYRDPTTFEPLSDDELNRRRSESIPAIQCADVNNNSVCWIEP